MDSIANQKSLKVLENFGDSATGEYTTVMGFAELKGRN